MAQMSEQELADIISRDKPGFKVLKREPAGLADDALRGNPTGAGVSQVRDLGDLRERYLGADEHGVADSPDALAIDDHADLDDEIVVVGPQESADDPWRPGPGPKSVVVSGKERRVVAEQG